MDTLPDLTSDKKRETNLYYEMSLVTVTAISLVYSMLTCWLNAFQRLCFHMQMDDAFNTENFNITYQGGKMNKNPVLWLVTRAARDYPLGSGRK